MDLDPGPTGHWYPVACIPRTSGDEPLAALEPGMTDTQEDKATRGRGLTPGHWVGIATIAVAVLGGVLSWGLSQQNARLSENNTRLANVESAMGNMAEGLARVEGSSKTINEHLNGFEQRVDERFNRVDERFDRIDERFDRIETNIDERFDRIETKIETLIQLHVVSPRARGMPST